MEENRKGNQKSLLLNPNMTIFGIPLPNYSYGFEKLQWHWNAGQRPLPVWLTQKDQSGPAPHLFPSPHHRFIKGFPPQEKQATFGGLLQCLIFSPQRVKGLYSRRQNVLSVGEKHFEVFVVWTTCAGKMCLSSSGCWLLRFLVSSHSQSHVTRINTA